jgi:hypothetical protein
MIADLSIMEDSLTTPEDDNLEKLETRVSIEQQTSHSEAMKLVVRSPYWGRILKGKTRRNYDNGGMPGIPYRVIGCQAVLSAVEGQYWGCCPHHGKRVLELKEYHFADHFTGDWDLFMVGSSVAPNYVVHSFFLLPRDQNIIDLNYKVAMQGWTFIGTASASLIRMELEGMLSDVLKQNDGMGYHFHHVHLEILMNQVFDRETPRSRRVAVDKSHNERMTENSVATSQSPRSGGTSDDMSTAPPIPQVVSNDASWLSDAASTQSTSTFANSTAAVAPPRAAHHLHHPVASMSHPWIQDATRAQFHPAAYPPTWASGHEHVQWFPASMTPLGHLHARARGPHGQTGGPPILPPISPAQQILHQGYVGNSVLPSMGSIPSAYFSPGTGHPSQYIPGFAGDLHPPATTEYSYFAPPLFRPSIHEEGRDDGEEAISGRADEKYSEDVATASVSETTQEEEEEADQHHHPSPSIASGGR